MARHPVADSKTPAGGFTLVEILVVLAILATLISLVAATIPRAMKAKKVTQAQTLINSVGAALELLRNDNEQYGKYPPSRSRDVKFGKILVGKDLGMPNETNVGIETIFFILNNPEIHVAQVTTDVELIGNTDEDSFRSARGTAQDAYAREYLDPWGQPLVYIHANDYKDPKGLGEILTVEGVKIHVWPKKMPTRAGGGLLNPNSFQLFSVGPNGEQDPDEAEESDDIFFPSK
jgi:prepilin-type N-terminal cleavage/methylation domain-containing protein